MRGDEWVVGDGRGRGRRQWSKQAHGEQQKHSGPESGRGERGETGVTEGEGQRAEDFVKNGRGKKTTEKAPECSCWLSLL